MCFHKLIITVDGQHQPIFKIMRKYETALGRRNTGQGANSSGWIALDTPLTFAGLHVYV